jgi:hypothetical protein
MYNHISSNYIPESLNLGINISDLGYHTKQKTNNTYDKLGIIPYREDECNQLYHRLISPIKESQDFFPKLFRALEDDTHFSLDLRRQVQRLGVRLHLYSMINPKNGYIIQPKDYLFYNLTYGPSFTKWLSKARSAVAIQSLSSRFLVNNEEFINEYINNPYKIVIEKGKRYDYDSLLNERYLIDFEETDSDFHWAFKPIETKERFINLFRNAAREMLREFKAPDIKPPRDEDFSTWISDSVTQTDDGPCINRTLLRKFCKEGTLKEKIRGPYIGNMRFKRQVVQVEPGNVRDTWQCFPETLFCIKRISHLLRQVLQPIPFSMMCDPKTGLQRRKMLKKKIQYFMFDFKKCGLTVNRELITILGEELELLYPGKGFKEIENFRTVEVLENKFTHFPIRGVGLGNCNEGITLLQCVIGYIVKNRSGIDSLFFNDDGVFADESEVRTPFTMILTLMSSMGMIINLEKTIISKCNVFCEDYVTDKEVDYRKLQHSILCFADVFFKKNICTAKNLYYTLQRSLIGKRAHVNILDSLIRYYGFEFHKMEIILPFEFGGWMYYGRTTINEVLRFAFDPRVYLGQNGFIPFIREWIGFLIRRGDLVRTLSVSRKIRYREFVGNPFLDPFTNHPHSKFAEELLSSLGIRTNQEIRENLNSLYNNRGSKNAKPKIKAGFSDKLLKYRKHLWNTFKSIHHYGLVLQRQSGHLMLALKFLRENEIIPMNYLPPDFTIDGLKILGEYKKLRRVVVSNFAFRDSEYSRYELSQLGESLLFKELKPGTKLFSLSSEIKRKKKEYILSDIPLKAPEDELNLPNWLYLFVNKKKYAVYLYTAIYGDRFPVYWIKIPTNEKPFDMALNPIKYIFPNCHTEFVRILSLSPKREWQKFIEEVISNYDIKSQEDFKILLKIIRESFEDFLKASQIEQYSRDEYIINEFKHFSIDDDLAEIIVGEKNDDELIEEYIIDNAADFDPDDEFITMEEEAPDEKSGSEFSDPDRDFLEELKMDFEDDD